MTFLSGRGQMRRAIGYLYSQTLRELDVGGPRLTRNVSSGRLVFDAVALLRAQDTLMVRSLGIGILEICRD